MRDMARHAVTRSVETRVYVVSVVRQATRSSLAPSFYGLLPGHLADMCLVHGSAPHASPQAQQESAAPRGPRQHLRPPSRPLSSQPPSALAAARAARRRHRLASTIFGPLRTDEHDQCGSVYGSAHAHGHGHGHGHACGMCMCMWPHMSACNRGGTHQGRKSTIWAKFGELWRRPPLL